MYMSSLNSSLQLLRKPFLLCLIVLASMESSAQVREAYVDKPFPQEYSVKFEWPSGILPTRAKVLADLDGRIQVLAPTGLLRPDHGTHLHPGRLTRDVAYLPTAERKVQAMAPCRGEIVYADDRMVFSNAWAGKLYVKHRLDSVTALACSNSFTILASDGRFIHFIKDSLVSFQTRLDRSVLDIQYDAAGKRFWVLCPDRLLQFPEQGGSLTTVYSGEGLTCFALMPSSSEILLGTHDGYLKFDQTGKATTTPVIRKLPATDITVIRRIGDRTWFGTTAGAFALDKEGIHYYVSKRWLASDHVLDIREGPGHSMLVLSDKGLARIHEVSITLEDKADYYERQVRLRHIRHGFNASLVGMSNGDLTTGHFENSDNDGLWTSMYLGAEALRYAVTKSPEALRYCQESLAAMERLYTINKIAGFPSRSFERTGYNPEPAWRKADEDGWDWKSTTSSDEAIGHIFAFGVIAEVVDDPATKKTAIMLIDTLMSHIIDHDMYLIDWNGQPTKWGRWNPEYVNARPEIVGDRKICSSNIIAMLQTAYKFTGKQKFKDKAIELMDKYGYLKNLMTPMATIAPAPADADELSKELSDGWNHSDDEMYFLGYWGLYRYALNDKLKTDFRKAIIDHWEIERPEKEGAWDIFTAMTGASKFDLPEAVWYLQQHPLDLINWSVVNSTRKDIEHIPANFRNQTIREVLPPQELPINRHNSNRFQLDGGSGTEEYSAGDIWLLPYWMGRYLGVIKPASAKSDALKEIE
jgi:hypothetical protein